MDQFPKNKWQKVFKFIQSKLFYIFYHVTPIYFLTIFSKINWTSSKELSGISLIKVTSIGYLLSNHVPRVYLFTLICFYYFKIIGIECNEQTLARIYMNRKIIYQWIPTHTENIGNEKLIKGERRDKIELKKTLLKCSASIHKENAPIVK